MAKEEKPQIELNEGEIIEKEFKSDYWDSILYTHQNRGIYYFTNQRIVFKNMLNLIEIPYDEIESLKTCNVGGGLLKVVPTGIKLTMRDGKKHCLSVTKRKEIIAFINEKIS